MEITQEYCTNTLHDQFIHGGFSQIDNVSRLMKNSRGDEKSECLSYFDNSVVAVKDTLNIWMETEKEDIQEEKKEEKPVEAKQNNFQASIESISFDNFNFNNPLEILNLLWLIWKWILLVLLIMFLISLFIRVWKRFLRYAYAFCNSHRLIFQKYFYQGETENLIVNKRKK